MSDYNRIRKYTDCFFKCAEIAPPPQWTWTELYLEYRGLIPLEYGCYAFFEGETCVYIGCSHQAGKGLNSRLGLWLRRQKQGYILNQTKVESGNIVGSDRFCFIGLGLDGKLSEALEKFLIFKIDPCNNNIAQRNVRIAERRA